jgi:DNA replication protein DnaC
MNNLSIFPRNEPIEACPTCKTPLEELSHGWVKAYWREEAEALGLEPHTYHTEKCAKRYGFCLIPCPMCSGGVEAKHLAQTINSLFKDSNIPAYAQDWTFTNYPDNADSNARQIVSARVADWLEGKPTKGGLYLYGDKGRCKTSLAIAALHYWLRKGHSGVFISTVELFSRLKESIAAGMRGNDAQDRFEASQGARLIRLVRSVELLILDDLGVECGSPYEIRELYLVLEARRSHGHYTIFTSNRDAASLAQYWRNEKQLFQDSQRIIDRLGEYAFTVPVAGRNQRERKG